MAEVEIAPKEWRTYILPVLEEQTIPSIIFYSVDRTKTDFLINVRTVLNGFHIHTQVSWNKVREEYTEAPVEINETGEMPDTLPESTFERFRHDFMNGRGIKERTSY